MVAAPLLMLLSQALPFVTALQVRSLAVVCVNIALNLYILDYIRRKDSVTSEPLRLAFLGISWFIGPALGIFLSRRFGLLPVCLLSAGFAPAALGSFWFLRIDLGGTSCMGGECHYSTFTEVAEARKTNQATKT